MPRATTWSDPSVRGGYGGPNRERQYRGKEGEKHAIRVVGEPVEFRVHSVDDVLAQKSNGEPNVFPVNCAKTWDADEKAWTGECRGCDKEYKLSDRYVAGIVFLAVKKGKGEWEAKAPANAVYWWDFAATRFETLRELDSELREAGKTLAKVELVVSVEQNGEEFQKLLIQKREGKSFTTPEHLAAYKAEGPAMVAEVAKAPTVEEQERRLKKRKPSKKPDDGPDDDEDDDEEEDDDIDDGGAEGSAEVEEAPAKAKKGTKGSPKAKAEESDDEDESTGDDDVEGLLDDLEKEEGAKVKKK